MKIGGELNRLTLEPGLAYDGIMPTTSCAISADSPLTAAAGAQAARQGGNAVDIAVCAALAASVSEVLMCSLGGSAFAMVHLPGRDPELIDGADTMPAIGSRPGLEETEAEIGRPMNSAWRRVFLPYGDGIEVRAGFASVGVPGMPAALELAWQRHGSLPWREIVAPALELARGEVEVGPTMEKWLTMSGEVLFRQQDACRDVFFPDGRNRLRQGDRFRIPRLEHTWQCISEQGMQSLYKGELAAEFVRDMREGGGLIDRDDLAAYQAVVRQPLRLQSAGFELALNPPPAVGGAAVGTLIGLVDRDWPTATGAAERAMLQARAQTHLLSLREEALADPDFDRSAADRLLAEATLRERHGGWKSPNTTHLSVATGDGSLVAITMSMGYGAGVILPRLGIACNNSLGEPELNPAGYHQAAGGSRLVSNMAPTVAWHRDGRGLALGSPGASRITTSIAQTWVRYALEGLDFTAAVDAPRLHIEPLPGGLTAQFEPGIATRRLADRYLLRPFEDLDMYFGAVKLSARDAEGRLHAVADRRRQGATVVLD